MAVCILFNQNITFIASYTIFQYFIRASFKPYFADDCKTVNIVNCFVR
jgi:hypothetical protein